MMTLPFVSKEAAWKIEEVVLLLAMHETRYTSEVLELCGVWISGRLREESQTTTKSIQVSDPFEHVGMDFE